MPDLHEYKIGKVSDILIRELYKLKTGETFVVTADTESDGICLNTSVWLDGEQILDRGKVVPRDLLKLAKKLGMSQREEKI